MRFEYKIIFIGLTEIVKADILDTLGDDGWELVAVVPNTAFYSNQFIFKRKKT